MRRKKNEEKEKEEEKVVGSRNIQRKSKKLHDAALAIIRLRKTLVLMLIFLLVLYFALKIAYDTGRFTIVLDTSSDMKGALVMYANKDEKLTRRTLKADVLDFITNIS